MDTPCILWQGRVNSDGYGATRENTLAHREAYKSAKGEIPNGLVIDHLCRVLTCVNPDHLEAVTIKENTLRGYSFTAINARKTHCNLGHEFTPENTYKFVYIGRARRRCRTCNNAASVRYKNKLSVEPAQSQAPQ